MPEAIKTYVRYVEALNRILGKFAMYLVFAMMGILLFSSLSRTIFNVPHIWAIEMAQFTMAAYYLLGGGFSMMQVSYILMGMFLDDTAMLVIVAPLYIPLVISLGFNPIWYGVLYTITCQIAYMTPPFGYNLFLMKAMAPKEISLVDIYNSIVPFVIIMLIGLCLVTLFPQIALLLPEAYYAK